MKKVLFMFLMVMIALVVVACGNVTTQAPTTGAPTTAAPTTVAPTTQAPTTVAPTTQAPTTVAPTTEAPTTVEQDTIAPVINGVDDVTIYLNETFDPMAGVTATDNKDGDITSSITVAGVVDTTVEGTNFLVYTVYDAAGNKKQESRYVYVEIDPSLIGDEMVQNGDFSLGNAVWSLGLFEGGDATLSVVDGVGVLNIASASWAGPASPRLESNVMEFENGVTYQVTFKAKADAVRSIQVQVGKLLPAAPWFDDYMPAQPHVYDLSTDWQTFTFKFTHNKATGEGQLLFGNGTVTGGVGTDNLATVVYYDDIVIVESTADPDTQAPVITGATDLTLETGAVYDPLAGVSAYDVVDGDITLDSTHYVSNVDTSVPGEYEVTYTVSDAAGNTATITISVTVVDLVFTNTNDITDGTFTTTTTIIPEVQDTEENGYADITDPEIWYQYTAGWDGAAATFTVVDGKAVIEVTAPGNNDWGLMLKQKGITLVPGETYKLSFSASSTVARDIVAKVSDDYFSKFSIGTEETTYSFIFTYEKDSTTTERVLFLFGQMANYAASTVTIDNVELSILEQEELVTNGEFDSIPWGVYNHAEAGAASTLEIVDGQLLIDVTNVGSAFWNVQLFQEGIVLVPGLEYTITFEAKSSVARDISLVLITDVENRETFNLTTEMATYTFTFTYNGTLTSGKIDFELGHISESSVPSVVTFDNITMTDGTNPVVIDFGNFDGTYAWGYYNHAEAGAASTLEIVDGQLLMDVTSIGSAFWNVQLFQDNVALVEGATYTMSFVAKSSVARDMSFVLIASGEFRKTFDLTTEFAVYTYTFVYTGTASLGKLDFELGNISAASVPALVTFESISFYRTFNPLEEDPVVPTEEVWTAYGTMTLEETETEKTITYVAGDANWWDSNVQGSLVEFDGTNNAIVFTITGVAGHEY
ncbi:MAG: carbohydrate binding domain-containing protein, partial [Candidatus Izemoplasmatales bacterium]|nr:carbohydrate binding domain-containing protein [Candidatus Izemoplasmatales bacterium]